MTRQISATRDSLFGTALVVLGGAIAIATATGVSGAHVAGPKLFPYLISAGLVMTGVTFLKNVLAGLHLQDAVELNWRAVGLVFLGLWAELAILIWFGWIPAATVLFIAVASAFGYRGLLVNALLGVLLAMTLFLGFNYGLGLELPLGSVFEAFVP